MSSPTLSRLRKLQAQAQALLEERDIFFHGEKKVARWHTLAAFIIRVYKSFVRNRCLIRAAALSYTSVLAMVPLFAVVASIYAGFLKKEGQEAIQHGIDRFVASVAPMLGINAPELKEVDFDREKAVNKIYEFVQNMSSGALTASAFIVLVFVAISLLSTIEATFNDMWGISQGRSWATRVGAYWAALTLGPLFLGTAVGITGASFFQHTQEFIQQFGFFSTVFRRFILPCSILSSILFMLYLLLPNTKVNWKAALVGAVVAGVLLQLNSLSTFLYASTVKSYARIYEGLLIVPLFLFGLYVTWIIVLLGAQVAYAYQNRRAYIQEKRAENVNQRGREFIAFRLMACIASRFHRGTPPPTSSGMAEEMGIPLRLVSNILAVLVEARLLVEVAGKETGYAPARPLDQITEADILLAMRAGRGQELETSDDPAKALVKQDFEAIHRAEREVASSITLLDIVNRLEAPQPAEARIYPLPTAEKPAARAARAARPIQG